MSASAEQRPPLVRDLVSHDEAPWRRLWAGYLDFYAATVDDSVTAATWQRLLTPGSQMFCRVAEHEGTVVGFAVCVLHPGTWTRDPICYLEDLFVDPAARGGGVGSALLTDLIDRCRDRGWSRLYWHTSRDNAAARRLYDRFTHADDFVRYRLFLR